MRVGIESVGRWGAALLLVTAAAGVALGAHGWAARHTASVPHSLGSQPGGTAAAPHPTPSAAVSSAQTNSTATAQPSVGPSAGPTGKPGPLLRAMPYAQYAYQIYPGKLTAAARLALAGLNIGIHRQGAYISVTAAVNGGPTSSPQLYAANDRVYVIEAALGDDSGATDYNLGDDSLAVTDVQGRIIQ